MEQSLLTDPGFTDDNVFIVRPIEVGLYKLLGPYGEKKAKARWAILTDGISVNNQLRTTIDHEGKRQDGKWRIRNGIGSAKIEVTQVNAWTRLRLEQDTRNSSVYGCGEVDLMLLAVAPVEGLIQQPGIVPLSEQVSLAEMQSLIFSWGESLREYRVGSRCQLGFDVAIFLGSVYFKNSMTDQTFEYEVYSFDSRPEFPSGDYFVILPSGAFVGVADNIKSEYGMPYLTKRQSRQVSLDILPRVRVLLAGVPNPLVDKELSHWKVLMVSVGSFVNGAAQIVSIVSEVNLVSET